MKNIIEGIVDNNDGTFGVYLKGLLYATTSEYLNARTILTSDIEKLLKIEKSTQKLLSNHSIKKIIEIFEEIGAFKSLSGVYQVSELLQIAKEYVPKYEADTDIKKAIKRYLTFNGINYRTHYCTKALKNKKGYKLEEII